MMKEDRLFLDIKQAIYNSLISDGLSLSSSKPLNVALLVKFSKTFKISAAALTG